MVMKKILLLLSFVFISLININAQPAQLSGIYPKYNLGSRPLEDQTHEYDISLIYGSSDTYIQLRCTNGVFTVNNSSSYSISARSSFSVKVKWGKAGAGEIYGSDGENHRASYGVIIEKAAVSISGPSTVKYNEYAEYTLSFNPNIGINSLTWNNSPEFEYVSGQNTLNYKVRLIKNDSKTINNAIVVTANTDFGNLSATKSIDIKPVLSINSNNTVVCNGNNVSYSINSLMSGATITWQAGTNMALVSGQGTANATFRASGNGYGTVKAIVTYNGENYSLENSQVWVGPPRFISSPNYESTQYRDILETFFLTAIFNGTPTSYTWKVNGSPLSSRYLNDDAGTISIPFKYLPAGNYTYTVAASNSCGTVSELFFVTITNEEPNEGKDSPVIITKSAIYTPSSTLSNIKIYSFPTGSLVYKENKAINFDIQNTTLNAGIYILEKTDEAGNVTREKVMKIK
jgi:hypothetical protein